MNQNNLNENFTKNKSEQPIGFKAERLTEKKLKALGRFEKIHGKSAETLLERGKIYLEKDVPHRALTYLKKSLELKKILRRSTN